LRTIHCPHCTRSIDRSTPFCPHCGLRLDEKGDGSALRCLACGADRLDPRNRYCGRCGETLEPVRARETVDTAPRGMDRIASKARLAMLDATGDVTRIIPLNSTPTILGRLAGDRVIGDGVGPEQIELFARADSVRVRPLGGGGPMYVFIAEPQTLADNDILLVGSQLLRFRELGVDGEDRDASPQFGVRGSLVPARDVAVLEQVLEDGTVRDRVHMSPLRSIVLGREHGDWVFPYDPTMSALHAEIRPRVDGRFEARDLGSRNGLAVLVRTERDMRAGERLLLGGQMMRVELA
jgi:Double zinc ribbon/FHA domain